MCTGFLFVNQNVWNINEKHQNKKTGLAPGIDDLQQSTDSYTI